MADTDWREVRKRLLIDAAVLKDAGLDCRVTQEAADAIKAAHCDGMSGALRFVEAGVRIGIPLSQLLTDISRLTASIDAGDFDIDGEGK